MQLEFKKQFIINFIYGAIILGLVYLAIKYALGVLAPFLLAYLIVAIMRKPTKLIVKMTKAPYKPIAMLMVLVFYLTIGVIVALAGIKLVSISTIGIAKLPHLYSVKIEPFLYETYSHLEKLLFNLDPAILNVIDKVFTQMTETIGKSVSTVSMKALTTISSIATSLPGLFIKTLIMIISSFFIAGDYEIIGEFIFKQFSEKTRNTFIQIKEYIVGTLFVCIKSYALIMTLTFSELAVGLSLIRVDNAIMIALIISIFDILPVLGTGGIMIPWAIFTAIRGNFKMALALILVYLAITVIRNILEPKIVGGQLGLHPIVSIMSMFVGAHLFGVLGLFGFPIILSLIQYLNKIGTINILKN